MSNINLLLELSFASICCSHSIILWLGLIPYESVGLFSKYTDGKILILMMTTVAVMTMMIVMIMPSSLSRKNNFKYITMSLSLRLCRQVAEITSISLVWCVLEWNGCLPKFFLLQLYMYQLCRSLAYLHSLGICHRDIKPQNLLLDPESGILKLCDFGRWDHHIINDWFSIL